jgi:S-adenosylmethionine:tRNA ribosyltransferase-isomerase
MGDEPKYTFELRDYSYDLPEGLIAQSPAERREASRLLIMDRRGGHLEHGRFTDLARYLRPGDVLVMNDTRVVPARLFGVKESGGRAEILVLNPYKDPELGNGEGYECLIKTAKPSRPESRIMLEGGIEAQVMTRPSHGKARVRFLSSEPLLEILDRIGKVPLPPYIQRQGNGRHQEDAAAYQTVYARKPGAVAAPTAGLHFTRPLLDRFEENGIETVTVTLHVGFGTFAPIRTDDIREHSMHAEYAEVGDETARAIDKAAREGRRVVAVGTTVVRTLEWVALTHGCVTPFRGFCTHYIYPGYRFRVVDALVTNFHLPGSTLILLVSAFAGRELVLDAYREAVANRYRFYSYGDAMLII